MVDPYIHMEIKNISALKTAFNENSIFYFKRKLHILF